MIRRAVPVRFDRVTTAGRNRPLLVAIETAESDEHEAYLKISGRPEMGVEGLANEVLAACLAGDLGLPINEPFLIDLSAEWIASIPDPQLRAVLASSAPIAFASKAAGPQWKVWSKGDRMSDDRVAAATAIFAFDAWIDNVDRRPDNSNCLVKGSEFRIIDHELAFRLMQKLPPRPEPWRLGDLHPLVHEGRHIFGAALQGRKLNLDPVRRAWADLSPTRLDEYLEALPTEWAAARPAMDAALNHLNEVYRRLDDCLAELERALT